MEDIFKGQITKILEGGKTGEVVALGKIYPGVLFIYPYGFSSNMQVDKTSQVLLFRGLGNDDIIYGIPYNVLLQPELEESEVQPNAADGVESKRAAAFMDRKANPVYTGISIKNIGQQ